MLFFVCDTIKSDTPVFIYVDDLASGVTYGCIEKDLDKKFTGDSPTNHNQKI